MLNNVTAPHLGLSSSLTLGLHGFSATAVLCATAENVYKTLHVPFLHLASTGGSFWITQLETEEHL